MFSLIVFFVGVASCVSQEELLVKTKSGSIQGHYNELNVREWNGIPYSEKPVGERRFEQSVAVKPWDDVYSADFMAPACPQTCNLPPGTCPEYGQSEDCLYLSVWSPTEPSSDPNGYPVYFWIHGGSFVQGEGDCGLYNGTNYAQKGVVSVVINYRLGALGFMASDSMEGNYGLLDQRLALQWTRDNIAGFGGDEDRITIGGQSAGGSSVGAHLIAEGSKGMFAQAVMESNPLALPFHTRETASENANAVFEYCGCAIDDVACMKSVPVDQLLVAQKDAPSLNLDNLLINFLTWSPLVTADGAITEQPLGALEAGHFDAVNIMSGTMADEGQMFVYELFTSPMGEKAYHAALLGIFGKDVYAQLVNLYPFDLIEGANDGRTALNVLATDLIFYCPLRNATRGYQRVEAAAAKEVQAAETPTYVYRFDHVLSFDCWGPDYEFCVGYVCHSSELPFQFDVFTIDEEDGSTTVYETTAEEKQLTKDTANLWANFITSGNPNKGFDTHKMFPAYSEKLDEILVLEEPSTGVKSHERELHCDFWDRAGYYY